MKQEPLALLNDIVDAIAAFWQWFRSNRRAQVAAHATIFVGGSMAKIRDDQPAPFSVQWKDAEGAVTSDLGGETPTAVIDNPSLATVTMTDNTNGTVQAISGWDQQASPVFHITVSTSKATGTSEDIEIDPGVAVSDEIVISSDV